MTQNQNQCLGVDYASCVGALAVKSMPGDLVQTEHRQGMLELGGAIRKIPRADIGLIGTYRNRVIRPFFNRRANECKEVLT
jgi:hypothetical protein